MFKRCFLILIALMVMGLRHHVIAQAPQEAFQLVKTTVTDALKIIDNPKIASANKRNMLGTLVSPFFDFKTITMLTVGKEYWGTISPADAQALTTSYQRYLMKFYLDKVIQFSTGKVTYGAPISVSATKAHIPVTMTGDGRDYKMLYKLYFKNGWKAYDFELEGVSVIQTYHTQFEPYLEKNNIAGLLKVLK